MAQAFEMVVAARSMEDRFIHAFQKNVVGDYTLPSTERPMEMNTSIQHYKRFVKPPEFTANTKKF